MNNLDLSDPNSFLAPTEFLDYESPSVVDFVAKYRGEGDVFEQALNLYYAVRDKISYNPHHIDLSVAGLCASRCIESRRGWCVNKAVVYAACCRAIGVPAVLGYADVKNHITTPKLRAKMGSDVFYWHSYAKVYLKGHWVKATPAFNQRLCNKFGIYAAEFNGVDDSIFLPFNKAGDKHMEYLNFRGEYEDLPLASILDTYQTLYPNLLSNK
ncbi:MAG: transglutaminase-like domain-containing protein [Psychrobium sp.]